MNFILLYCSEFIYETVDPGCHFNPKVSLFGVFQVGMTSADVGTDTYQTCDYFLEGHIWWAVSTLSLMFVPITTCFLTETLTYIVKYWQGKTEHLSWRNSFKVGFIQ